MFSYINRNEHISESPQRTVETPMYALKPIVNACIDSCHDITYFMHAFKGTAHLW